MAIRRQRRLGCGWAPVLLAAMLASPAGAVNVVLDFTYDTGNFFAAGSQARSALQAAATFFSELLQDNFSSISKPADFYSSTFNGVAYWDWSLNFSNPSGPGTITLNNQTIAAGEYRVYAGARDIVGTALGTGGPGGFQWSSGNNGGFFTQAEITQINQITSSFSNSVTTRGQASGFARWGGSVSFDSVGVIWHFNHTTLPPAGTNDFYSVALHELAHALGFGASDEWNSLVSGGSFQGTRAVAEYGAPPPLTGGHWTSGTMSRVFGTNTVQEAAMDPEITVGTRKLLTSLDAAALADIGWSIVEPPPPAYHPADFNQDGLVNSPDLTIWRNAFLQTSAGDANGDNRTDGHDFLIWQRSLGQTGALTVAAGVPEPTGAAVAGAVAMAGMHIARRRRGKAV